MITVTSFFGLPLRAQSQRRLLVVLYYGLLLFMAAFGFVRNKRLPGCSAAHPWPECRDLPYIPRPLRDAFGRA